MSTDLFPELSARSGVLIQFKLWPTLLDQITALEQWVRKDLTWPDLLARRQSVPGIGPILGMTILLDRGAIERFDSVGDYASYCRMVESVRPSYGKHKETGNPRCSNRYLCRAYMQAANFALRYHPSIRRWYDRKHRVVAINELAIKAVAHKLARACWHMLREDTPFDPTRAFALITRAVAGRNPGLASSQYAEGSRPPAPVLYSGPHADRAIRGGLQARDSVRRMMRTWTDFEMTDECLDSSKGRYRSPNQNGRRHGCLRQSNAGAVAETGAILAPHETQWLLVSGNAGHHLLRRESETGFCVPIDPGGEKVTPAFARPLGGRVHHVRTHRIQHDVTHQLQGQVASSLFVPVSASFVGQAPTSAHAPF